MAGMDDPYLLLFFAIVGLPAFGLTALILVHSDPKPTRSTWMVAITSLIASLAVAFFAVVIAINLLFG